MIVFLIVMLVWWLIFGNFIEVVIMRCKLDINCPLYFPSWLYEATKMNWFGCWFCFILIRLLCPLNTLIGIILIVIYYICIFFKWLFTVGREDD